jgi:signal transduction histidine kinase
VEAVLNTTEDGIAFIDSRAMFTIVNQPFLQILQIEGNQLLGKPFFATARHLFRHVRDLPTVINRLRDLVRTPHSNLLMTVYLSGERTRIIRVASVGVRAETAPGAGSEWLGRIITLRDVTRETEVDRMKTEFVSTVSHELRTPLTAIKGYLDLMLDGQAGHITATQREFLSLAGESTDRLTTLINDILDISRIEAGGTRLRRIPTDYRPVVQHVVHMLTGQAKAKGIALGMQFTKINPWVEGRSRFGLPATMMWSQHRLQTQAQAFHLKTLSVSLNAFTEQTTHPPVKQAAQAWALRSLRHSLSAWAAA